MADFSHIQAVQTVVGEVFILIMIVQKILRDKTSYNYWLRNILRREHTTGWTRQVGAPTPSGWQRGTFDNHLPKWVFYWSPFLVTCPSTHFLFVFVFNHLPNCAFIICLFLITCPSTRFYLSLLIITFPSPHFFLVLVSYSPAQVRVLKYSFLFLHVPIYALFICLSFLFPCPSTFFYYLPLFVLFRLPKYGLFFASVFYSPTQVRSFHLPAKICYSHAQVPVASHSTRNMTMII